MTVVMTRGNRPEAQVARSRPVLALAGYAPNNDTSIPAIGEGRKGMVTMVPGALDRPIAYSLPMPTGWGVGTTSERTDRAKRIAAAWEVVGPAGSRQEVRIDPRSWRPGNDARVAAAGTPSAPLAAYVEEVNGEMVIGSPVTTFSRFVERSDDRICPETGQRQTRRFTTTSRSLPSEITPGGMRKTGGITTYAGAVAPLAYTPLLAGVESIVDGTPPPTSGVALAVGTEDFGRAGASHGPYGMQPASAASPRLPRTGQRIGDAHYQAMAPGYEWQGKGGTPVRAVSMPSAAAVADPPMEGAKLGRFALTILGALLVCRALAKK